MMMVQLQPTDVAKFWDVIKVTMLQSNEVGEEVEGEFLNSTLEKCMSGKLACWVIFEYGEDGNKEIYTVMITSIIEDRLYGYKYVVIEGIYGVRRMSNEQAVELIGQLKIYAKNVKCKYVKALTNSPKAMRICEEGGAVNVGIVYSLEV